ncbi:MAG TPA: 2-dehydropantoate 2-reductase [Ktedonobacteraceae bacterium]|nr:2-dehydropantoate 2-reductase [Ktedonobacteraceae bacterium]
MEDDVDIIGIGGAGGLLASSLIEGSLSPRIISRGAALRQLREVGLTILTDNKPTIYAPVHCAALDDAREFAPLVLVTTKSYDIPALIEEIAPRVAPDTLLISVQNGFAAFDALSSAFGVERSAMGVLYVSASIVSPAAIDIKSGVAQLFLPASHRAKLRPLANALERGGMEAALVDDIERRMWLKQLFLVPFAILNARTRQPIGKVREDPQARHRWGEIASEIAAIARACDVAMPEDAAAASLAVADRFDPQADASFARDVWANRPHEADALFTPLLKRAKEHDVPCPLLQEAYTYYVK